MNLQLEERKKTIRYSRLARKDKLNIETRALIVRSRTNARRDNCGNNAVFFFPPRNLISSFGVHSIWYMIGYFNTALSFLPLLILS